LTFAPPPRYRGSFTTSPDMEPTASEPRGRRAGAARKRRASAPGGRSGRTRRKRAGRLKIGDEWMAIQIIALSQTNPQKAVAELVENSIDAGATRVTITRSRRRGRVQLRISDDGRGVPLNEEGAPDFDYVATHVCDSLKRKLDERQRRGVQGEFGIGLLGFWSIGRELEMISQSGEGPPHLMTMRSRSRSYDRRRYLGARSGSGVDLTIHDVHREAQSRLTAEKLQRYLGEELRERIRRSGVTIVLEDRLPPRRTLEVRPATFRGARIKELTEAAVRDHPPIRVELYLAPESGERAARAGATEETRPAVGLYRLGTRVCRDIATLPEFDHPPWNAARLEGILDYADFKLAPASREGFLPDAAYHAFVEGARRLEPFLLDRIRLEEEARSDRASRALVRELQSAFARVLRLLPSGDYDWFGADGRPFAGGGSGRPGGDEGTASGGAGPGPEDRAGDDAAAAGEAGEKESAVGGDLADEEAIDPPELQPALLTGPLESVTIRPGTVRLAIGARRTIRAVARDASGLVIEEGIRLAWSLDPGTGSLEVGADGRATLEAADRPSRGTIKVRARDERHGSGGDAAIGPDDPIERAATAEVIVESEAPRRAFPPPAFVHAPGEAWRSRWSGAHGKMEINSAHPDYQAVRLSASRRRRYLGRLYAKELVVHNFGHQPSAAALERMVEVLTRLEEHL